MLAIFGTLNASGQAYYTSAEVGLSAGASQYFGDLNQYRQFKTIGGAYGVYVRKHLNNYIAVKAVANYTKLSYDDKFNTVPFEVQRNLNFATDVYEVAAQAEFNFFKYITGNTYHRCTPYLTGGIGALYYNPYTMYKGTKYYLRPLGTEGQNAGRDDRKYSAVSVCFPIGVGVKYWLKAGINLSFEISNRMTATDYLDDVSTTYVGRDKFPQVTKGNPAADLQDRSNEVASVSTLGQPGKQRGNSASFDQYLMAQFSISFHFTTYRCPQFMNHELIKVY